MSLTRPILAAATLLAAPGPWLLETTLTDAVCRGLSRCPEGAGTCGGFDRLSLGAGGLRFEGLHARRAGVSLVASRAEVRPAWDGVDVHLEGLELARAASSSDGVRSTDDAREPTKPAADSASALLDTHGLTVRVQATGTTVLSKGGLTVLLDAPAVTIGPDGVPMASSGLTIQHAQGSVHAIGRLRATPRDSLRTWSVSGAVSIADGPPLRLRGEVERTRLLAELEHESGGWLHLAAWPDTRALTLEADRFALHGLGRLGRWEREGMLLDAGEATLRGRLQAEPTPAGGLSVHAEAVRVDDLTLAHPKLSASTITLGTAWVDGNATFEATDDFDADLTLGHDSLAVSMTASRRPQRAALRIELPDGPCQRLFDALPEGFADAMRGTRVDGTLGGHLELTVDFEAARARAALLEDDPLAEPPPPGTLEVEFPFEERCRVTADPSALDLEALSRPYRHRFVDAEGTPRSILVADGAPHTVELRDVPLLAGAFVTLEDARYFHHDGLDLEQVAGAVWHNLAAGEVERGASTITQQAARNLFLGLDRTAARKLQEAFVATRIDASVGKRRLLEIYLNIIELAPGVHGVQDAAQFYFGRDAQDLDALQATHLAMMAPAPRTYSERFVSGVVDEHWRSDLEAQVRRLARHHVIDRPTMLRALRSDLDLLDRR